MIIRQRALALCCLILAAVVHALHAEAQPEALAMTPSEMKWEAQGGLALPGMEQVNLVGDPSKPGPYTLRLKFPAGYKLAPHTHPDYRAKAVANLARISATPLGHWLFITPPVDLSSPAVRLIKRLIAAS